jgi:hypothetical protein
MEYKDCKNAGKDEGRDWATDRSHPQASTAVFNSSTIDFVEDHENITACLTDTKASHFISRSYKEAMAMDSDVRARA